MEHTWESRKHMAVQISESLADLLKEEPENKDLNSAKKFADFCIKDAEKQSKLYTTDLELCIKCMERAKIKMEASI